MKLSLKLSVVLFIAVGAFSPLVSSAESTKASGISTHSNGRFQIVSDATTLRTGTFYFPNVVQGSDTYNVTVTTRGYAATNGWQYYSDAELLEAATYVYDTGMGSFFAQSNATWTHDPGCGNSHTFTRTLVPPPVVVIPTGGGEICSAAFHIINETQTRAEHQTDCQALGSGWDLAEVTSSNASAINANIGGTAVVANRVLNTSDYEDAFKCSTESTWPESTKTLRYNGTCFDDIPDTTAYSRALCIDSTPLCNPEAGVCSTEAEQCSAGTYAHSPDSSTQYLWQCLGIDIDGDSGDVNCSKKIDDVVITPEPEGSFSPVCTLTPDNIVGLGETLTWTVQNLGSSPSNFNFNWSSYPDLVASNFVSANLTSLSPVTIDRGDITVGISGASSATISCPAAKVIDNQILIEVDKPIVEEGTSCKLSWTGVDTVGGVCGLYNEQGDLIHTIVDSSGNFDVDPTNKYVAQCAYTDANGVDIGIIQSEYVSCIKKGVLIEI